MKRTLGLIVLAGTLGCQGTAMFNSGADRATPGTPPVDQVPPGPYIPPTGDPSAPDACEGISVAASPTSLRRLSNDEQVNTFRDVLKDPALSPTLAPASGPTITEVEVEKLNLAAKAMTDKGGHLAYLPAGCNAAGAYDTACADGFIDRFGRMAFRRPLTAEEKQWLRTDIFDALQTNTVAAPLSPPATFREALDAVAQAILQAPQVHYIREVGEADPSLPTGVRRLTGFERATRLSLLFWGTTPDEQLLTAAQAGELDTAEGVRAQAQRLLDDPRAKGNIRAFVSEWLQLNGNSHQASLEDAPKSKTKFPFDSPALRAAMRQEIESLYEHAFFAPGGSFANLMTTPRAYVNKSLGALYGVTNAPTSDSTFAWVDLPATERAGLFTRAGFLTVYTPQAEKSPIRRGVFLYRHALCRQLGDPPPNVNDTMVPVTGHAMTAREQVEVRTAGATCQGCHVAINPLGFTLENYDAMGQYHTKETVQYEGAAVELPVNSDASPVSTDFDGLVAGPLALSSKLAESGMAHDCLAATWFARANPRPLTSADACSTQRLMRKFRETDDMHDLLLQVASDDSALFIQETP